MELLSQWQRVRWVLAVLCLSMAASAISAAEHDPLALFLQSSQSLQANFSQQVIAEDGELIEASGGRFWLARPGRFRWEYRTPYHQILVADGEQFWIYDEELAQVTVQPQGQVMGEAAGLLLAGQADVAGQFTVTLLSPGPLVTTYELRPRSEESGLERVELTFGGLVLQQMALWDKLGQTTQLKFTAVEQGLKLDPELFQFVPPEGVDVLGGPGDS